MDAIIPRNLAQIISSNKSVDFLAMTGSSKHDQVSVAPVRYTHIHIKRSFYHQQDNNHVTSRRDIIFLKEFCCKLYNDM